MREYQTPLRSNGTRLLFWQKHPATLPFGHSNSDAPHRSFCQVHQEKPLGDDKFCMDLFLQAQASRPKPAGHEDYFDAAGATGSNRTPFAVPRLQPRSFVTGSAFVGTSTSVGTRPKEWPPCLGLSSRLSFERVWVTQGFLCTPPGVVLDKTPRTSKRKFAIGRLTSSILNSSSLMLTELQKSPTSFDSFEKGVNLRSRPSSRLQPGTLETSHLSFPNRLSTSGHTLRGPRMARPTTRKSGRTETSQKTSDSFGNLCVEKTNLDGAPGEFSNEPHASRKSIPYTLPSLRNWASESGQSLLGIVFDVGAQKIDSYTLNGVRV